MAEGGPHGDTCARYDGASGFSFILLVLITLGIVISYLPQYHRIRLKKTSEGLSTQFLLLGSCSSLFTLTNIILVSSRARRCCLQGELSLFNCISSQINLVQISTQSVCAILILVFVLHYTRGSIKQDKNEYKRIVLVGKFVAGHVVVSILEILFGLVNAYEAPMMIIANVNGLLSTTLTMMKYIPQIYTTYKLKHPGTLSIGMMCVQTPGGALFTLTLFLSKGSHWSSWISYFVAFILQGTLLSLCVYYEYFKSDGVEAQLLERREIDRRINENLNATDADEHTDAEPHLDEDANEHNNIQS